MSLFEKVWDHSSFTQNNDRLISSDAAAEFLSRILAQAERKRLLSREHLTVDGTLIEAWASITNHPNYTVSQRIRKRIEEGFGWMKTIGRLRKTMYRGTEKIAWQNGLGSG